MRARQARGNEVLAAALERTRERGLHERLLALADAADAAEPPRSEAGVKARRVKGLDPDGPLADNAERIVRVRLDELCSFMPTAADPDEVVALHDMRIAAKRLRYVLEVTGPCFGAVRGDGDEAWSRTCRTCSARSTTATCRSPRRPPSPSGLLAADAAALRAAAGDAEDLDPALLKQAPHAREHAGLAALLVHLRARRRLLFDRFLELWGDYERKGFRARLEYAP